MHLLGLQLVTLKLQNASESESSNMEMLQLCDGESLGSNKALDVMVLSFPSLCLPSGELTRDNPYEDVKLSPMCLPIARPHAPKVT